MMNSLLSSVFFGQFVYRFTFYTESASIFPVEPKALEIMTVQGFSVNYRNPGHWDILTRKGRLFRIRGTLGKIILFDEREDNEKEHPNRYFKSVQSAMLWIVEELMIEGEEK